MTIDPAVTEQQVKELLRGRTVLVTGADGFVGSHLTEYLLEHGANVHVFVRAASSGLLSNLAPHIRRVTIHRGDLTDKQAVIKALGAVKSFGDKAVIFHLGAQAHVGESWGRPYETFAANSLGTLNLLQSIVDLEMDIYKFDTAGSSEEYGNVQPEVRENYRFSVDGGLILDERSPINPQSVYATSKVAADFLTRNFYAAYGVPALVTRMFNNYGPRQNPRFITGTIISQAMSRDVIELGYLGAKRDFCFVKDGARGHVHAALFGKPGEVYVYGYGQHCSMLDWYNTIIAIGQAEGLWGPKTLKSETEGRARLGKSEVEELRVDYAKLNQLTGWTPQWSWQQGLTETVRWFAANRDRWQTRVDW